MLRDADDVLGSPLVAGDSMRSKVLCHLNSVYLIKVLDVLFQATFKSGDLRGCINFMLQIKRSQPLVLDAMSQSDYELVARWQLNAVLQSASVMHEVLIKNDAAKVANDWDGDYNF